MESTASAVDCSLRGFGVCPALCVPEPQSGCLCFTDEKLLRHKARTIAIGWPIPPVCKTSNLVLAMHGLLQERIMTTTYNGDYFRLLEECQCTKENRRSETNIQRCYRSLSSFCAEIVVPKWQLQDGGTTGCHNQ
eukprot:5243274-Amphidinium_carterae.1